MSPRLLFATAAMLLLVACQNAGPDGKGGLPAAPDAAGEITVTPLDQPGTDAAATPETDAAATEGLEEAVPKMAADDLVPAEPDEPPAGDEAAPDAQAADQPQTGTPAVPEVVKSPSQIACEKKGGVFANAGSTGAKVCVRTTRDGGKSCDREGDCEGLCLARSRTCSPVTPVFGCQEILQQDGLQVTQCTE